MSRQSRIKRFGTPRALGAALLATCLVAAPGAATTNYFRPLSGAEFTAVLGCVHRNGRLVNPTGSQLSTSASLGRAQGGSNIFVVYGQMFGGTLSCTVTMKTDDGIAQAGNAISTSGAFQMYVPTNIPASSIPVYYTLDCSLPPGSSLSGVAE